MASRKTQELSQGLKAVADATETYARLWQTLADRVTSYDDEVRIIAKRKFPGIVAAADAAAAAKLELLRVIAEHADDFASPKSHVFAGMRVGLRKGAGAIDWDDEAEVVRLIEKHFPTQANLLVRTKKTPVIDALRSLSVADLQKIGCTVEETGDAPFVKPIETNVDKLVKALLERARKDLE